MNHADRVVAELLLQVSAQSIAGDKRPERHEGEVLWHGSQGGQICLLERRLKVRKPRLRTRGPQGREVAIPLYERLQQQGELAARTTASRSPAIEPWIERTWKPDDLSPIDQGLLGAGF